MPTRTPPGANAEFGQLLSIANRLPGRNKSGQYSKYRPDAGMCAAAIDPSGSPVPEVSTRKTMIGMIWLPGPRLAGYHGCPVGV